MLEIYLPIAQVNVDIFLLLFLSFSVGVLSGLFGVGGGFLMTPFLIFLGIPPVYAVPNEINNILATSVSGSLTHWFKNTLDYKMGLMIIIGGPVLGAILYFFENAGEWGWLYVWLFITFFSIIMQPIFNNFIAPMFNKFTPLEDGPLKEKITEYLNKVNFPVKKLEVVDGSKRSAHSNAYFRCLLYTSPSPRDKRQSRMPSSA